MYAITMQDPTVEGFAWMQDVAQGLSLLPTWPPPPGCRLAAAFRPRSDDPQQIYVVEGEDEITRLFLAHPGHRVIWATVPDDRLQ